MNKFKRIMKQAPAVIGLVGGLSAQYATLAGAINPRAGAVLTAIALGSAAAGESITKIKQVVQTVQGS